MYEIYCMCLNYSTDIFKQFSLNEALAWQKIKLGRLSLLN